MIKGLTHFNLMVGENPFFETYLWKIILKKTKLYTVIVLFVLDIEPFLSGMSLVLTIRRFIKNMFHD